MLRRRLSNWWIGKKHERLTACLILGLLLAYLTGYTLLHARTPDPVLGRRLQLAGAGGMFLLILSGLLHRNLYGSSRFLEQFRDTDRLPKKQIEQVLSVCMCLFLLVSALILGAAAWLAAPLTRFLTGLFPPRRPLTAPVTETAPLMEKTPAPPDLSALLGEAAPTPRWLLLLEKLLHLLCWAAVLLFFLFLLRLLLLRLWAWLSRPRHWDDDEKIYLRPSLFSLHGDGADGSAGSFFKAARQRLSPASYGEKIRRRYRLTIRSSMKKQGKTPQDWASPAELEQSCGIRDPLLHQLYEKARYGPGECSREDYETMRSCLSDRRNDGHETGSAKGKPGK